METVICGHEVLRDVSQLAPASLARRLARVQTWPVSPIPTYGMHLYPYTRIYVQKRAFVYTHTYTHIYTRIFKRVHRHVDTSRSISRHRVTDGSCTHLPSFRPSFPRKWSQVDPPPPPETPLMTKLANFDQLGSYLPPPFPISSSSLSLSPLHLLLSLSFSRLSLSSSHPWPTCSLSNARRIYLDR